MVDVGASHHAMLGPGRAVATAGNAAALDVAVRPADSAALSEYEALCAEAVHGPAQHPIWIRSWIEATRADGIVVTLRRGGASMALALDIVESGPFRIAQFMGGKHANGNFAPARGWRDILDARDGAAIAAAVRAVRPDVDLLYLERQNPNQQSVPNALAGLATMQSPNVSLAVDLEGGFEATLARLNGKRKRKKYRFQLNKFEGAGGYRLVDARTEQDVERLIGEFFEMKAARFLQQGIPDVFAPAEIQAFFRALFTRSLTSSKRPFRLLGLEVAGEVRAVNGTSETATSTICDFGGIRDDDSNASPGYFLDYTQIEQACADGKQLYDFSVGDETYKRSWCKVETWQFDVMLPLTLRGHLLFNYSRARSRVVRAVKANTTAWKLIKRLRKRSGDVGTAGDD